MANAGAGGGRPIGYPAETRGLNFFELDVNLRRLLARLDPELVARHGGRLAGFGAWVGGPLDEQAAYTDRYASPRLETHDPRSGEPLGRVVHGPAYPACHRECYRRGVVGLAFGADGERAPRVHA